MDLKQFATRMSAISTLIGDNSEKEVQSVAEEIFKTVISNTPYRTGKARSSWRARLNTPSYYKRNPYGSGIPYSSDDTMAPSGWGINASGAFNTGMKQIKKYKLTDSAIVLFNNQNYMDRLNRGHSNQAPANFVEKSRAAGASRALKIRLLKGI